MWTRLYCRAIQYRAATVPCLLVLAAFLGLVQPAFGLDNLASIRAQYEAAVSSLDSFEIRYTMIQRPKHVPPNEPAVRTIKLLWSESGTVKLLAIGDAEGVDWNRWRSVYSFDGTIGYSGSCREDDLTRVGRIIMTDGISSTYYQFGLVSQFLGRNMPGPTQSLSELLSRDTARVIGSEVIGDAKCVRCAVISDPPGPKMDAYLYDVWLDPAAAGLPRQISYSPGSNKNILTVKRFQSHPHNRLNSTITLPARMVWTQKSGVTEFTIDSVSMESIPKERFVIRPQIGTEVHEQFTEQPAKIYRHGPSPVKPTAERIDVSQPPQPVNATVERRKAVQERDSTVSWVFVGLGFLTLVGVSIAVLRRG